MQIYSLLTKTKTISIKRLNSYFNFWFISKYKVLKIFLDLQNI